MPYDRQADEQCRKLFIGGLSFETTDESLKEYFDQWGEITDCVVIKEKQTGRSKGFGFVTYATEKEADECVNFKKDNKHELHGRDVDVKRAVSREESGRPGAHVPVKKIFIGGLKEGIEEEDLREFFSGFGAAVESVEMMIDKETKKKRGFAFITFDSHDIVDKLVNKRHFTVKDKDIEVKKALSRTEMDKAKSDAEAKSVRRGGFRNGGGGGYGGRQGRGGGYGDSAYGNGGYGGSGYGRQGGYGRGQGGWGEYDDYGGGYDDGYGGGGYGSYGGGPMKGGSGYAQRSGGPYGGGYGSQGGYGGGQGGYGGGQGGYGGGQGGYGGGQGGYGGGQGGYGGGQGGYGGGQGGYGGSGQGGYGGGQGGYSGGQGNYGGGQGGYGNGQSGYGAGGGQASGAGSYGNTNSYGNEASAGGASSDAASGGRY